MYTEVLLFPFMYQLKQLRKAYKLYPYLVTLVEALFCINYFLKYAITDADSKLLSIIESYNLYILQNSTLLEVLTQMASLFIVMIIVDLILLYLKQFRNNHNSYFMSPFYKKSITFLTTVYSILQITIVPTFIIIVNNISKHSYSSISFLSIILLPIIISLIIFDYKQRLFQQYFIFISAINFIIPNNLFTILSTGIIVSKLAFQESSSQVKVTFPLYKKIFYIQMILWFSLVFLQNLLIQQINLYYLLITSILLLATYILHPDSPKFKNNIEQNRFLLDILSINKSEEQINHTQKLLIMNMIHLFQMHLHSKQKLNQQMNILDQLQPTFSRQKCLKFMLNKIQIQHRKQSNNIQLNIQLMYSKMLSGKFNMQILIDISRLTQLTKVKSNFQQRFNLFQLTSFVQKTYLKKQENVNAITVIQFQKKKDHFYSCITGITILMVKFWQFKKKNFLNQNLMFTIFSKIQQMMFEVEAILDDFKNSTLKQKFIYDLLTKQLNNTFKLQNPIQKINKINLPLPELSNSNYILVQQDKILQMSSHIRNQFRIKRSQMKDYKISDILPKLIYEYIHSELYNLVEESSNLDRLSHIVLPFIVPNHIQQMLPFKINLKIIPDILHGIKYIIHFQDSYDVQNAPSILYEAKSDRILQTTNNISSYFTMVWQIQLSNHLAQQVFRKDLYQIFKNKKDFDDPIPCHFHIRSNMVKNQGTGTKTKIVLPVKLKVIKCFKIKQEILYLIQIFKKRQYDQQSRFSINENNQLSKLQLAEASISHSRQRSVNQVFCKIKNPYEDVITQKFISLQDQYKFSYLKMILVLLVLILTVILATIFVLMVEVKSSGNDLINLLNANTNTNTEATNIYLLYSQSSILHQLITYPQQFLKLASYSIPSLIKQYTGKILADINSLLNYELQGVKRQNLNYTLLFNNFNISTTTDSSNIIDYLYNAQAFLANSDLSFLIRNWPKILVFISSFQPYNPSTLYNLANFQLIVCGCAIFIIIFIILVINCVCLKAKHILGRILNLYEYLSIQNCQNSIKNLNDLSHVVYQSHNFAKIQTQNQKTSLKHKKQHISVGHKLKNMKQQMSLDFQSNLKNIIEIIQNNAHQLYNHQQTQTKSIQSNSVFILFIKANIICLIPLLLCFFFIFYYAQTQKYSTQMQQIINYSDLLQNSCNFISEHASDFLVASLQQVLPLNQRTIPSAKISRQTFQGLECSLPSFYDFYKTNQTSMLNFNLCSYAFLNTGSLYKTIVCQHILGGIMQKGLSQTTNLYIDLIADFYGLQMKDFGSTYRVNAKYPVYMQIYYIRKTLFNMIIYLQGIFSNLTIQYINIWNNYLRSTLNYIWIIFVLIIVICIHYYYKIHETYRLALRSFYVLPKSFLLQMNITKKIRAQKILDQIQRLSF